MIELFISIFLLCEAVEDIKTQKLDLLKLIIFGVLAIFLEVFYIKGGVMEILGGALLGVFTLVISKITREAIGYGDGVVMIIMGICCGLGRMLLTFSLATLVMAIIAGVFMIRKGVKLDLRIPFIPCLLIGYVGGIFV